MSEHRRKPPQPQGGGRAAARRAQSGSSSGRRAAPRGATGSPSAGYHGPGAEERPQGGRAEARRAAQRSGGAGGGRRRAAPEGRRGRAAASRDRFIDYPRAGKYGAARWVPSWRLVTGMFVGFFAGLLLVGGVGYAMVDIPKADEAATAQNNVFYWSDGSQMASTGGKANRQIVPLAEIPDELQNAVIAAENASFYEDKGVDPMGIARALFNMAKGDEVQGGSTITQQFVKNTYLDQSQTLTRKFKELFISIKVGAKMEKEDILAGYLNTAYYGRDAYGVQAAAQAYFGKDSKKLTAEESVFLASVLKGPNLYNPDGGVGSSATPKANTQRAEKRWEWILDRMVEVDRMPQSERSEITDFPKLKKQKSKLAGQTGYLIDIAKSYVAKTADISTDELEKGGYRIYTTFDKDRVHELEEAVQETRDDLLDEKKRPDTDTHVQFGAASIDPDSGAIVAAYGGDGYDKGHYTNNADTMGVPVGSTWKPFVLASAMEYGTVHTDGQPLSPQSLYQGNDLTVINDQNGEPIKNNKGLPFQQKNEGTQAWGLITLDKAMEQSVNVPFVQLGIDVGLDNTRKTAMDLGILEDSFDSGNMNNASFSLGTSTPSAIRMADAYAGFASSGTHYEPYSVTKVIDAQRDVELPGFEEPEKEEALEPAVADNVTKVLENVVQNGTAKALADLPFPNAGKTGTTDENKSAWYVGYTSELSTAVAMFRTNPKDKELLSMKGVGDLPSIHGGDIPADVWKEYMSVAMQDKDYKPQPFPAPAPLGTVYNPSPSPEPSASETESEEDDEKDDKPTPSKPVDPPTDCEPFDFECMTNGGNTDGQTTDGGTLGETDSGGTTGSTDGGGTGGEEDSGTITEGTVFGNTNSGGGNGRGGTTG
ncbi:transglycosylase domain-containing protein [Streptomyces abyssomicinicus]|uniref:transglycosylase domain-containing protein n=1 Tax=Streptomyces abyssomicinicus TaxID=574929 RepID=UPI001250BC98|nr:transglycosylase domain-containing protein [Streptomyces abyssomicinicus]